MASDPTYDKFGTPENIDPTAQWEKDIAAAFEESKAMAEKVMPQLINRPIGSVPIAPEDQMSDYVMRDPNTYWQERFDRLVPMMGKEKAMIELLKHDSQMRGKVTNNAS